MLIKEKLQKHEFTFTRLLAVLAVKCSLLLCVTRRLGRGKKERDVDDALIILLLSTEASGGGGGRVSNGHEGIK